MTEVRLDQIVLDGLTQSRAANDAETIEDYAEDWREGAAFPPVDLFTQDGEIYWIGDGNHRVHAAVVAGRSNVPAKVHDGNERAALLFSCSVNQNHGLRRSNADKRNTVSLMLELEPKWSNRRIAEHAGVSDPLVSEVRKSLEGENRIPETKVREGRDGKRRPVEETTENADANAQLLNSSTPAVEGDEPEPDPAAGVDIEALARLYKESLADLNRMLRGFREVSNEPRTGAYVARKFTRIEKLIDDLKAAVSMAEPVAECEECYGVGCGDCSNTGFIVRMMQRAKA